MAQHALFQSREGKDPKKDREAAWDYLEQLRNPQHGAGLDEYEFCGGRAELDKSQRLPFFSEARSPHRFGF